MEVKIKENGRKDLGREGVCECVSTGGGGGGGEVGM